VLSIVQERLKYLSELPELTNFFFEDLPINLDLIRSHKQLKKLDQSYLRELLESSIDSLQKSDFTNHDLFERLNSLLEETQQKPAVLFSLIRIAITWAPASPGLSDTLAVLGKQRSIDRLKRSLQAL
jgi:glutamyl/glutaminyl-tRNA synthetase